MMERINNIHEMILMMRDNDSNIDETVESVWSIITNMTNIGPVKAHHAI